MIFEIIGKEEDDAKNWITEHRKECKIKTFEGAQFSFVFVPNSISSPIVIVKCVCGEEKNVTDFSLW